MKRDWCPRRASIGTAEPNDKLCRSIDRHAQLVSPRILGREDGHRLQAKMRCVHTGDSSVYAKHGTLIRLHFMRSQGFLVCVREVIKKETIYSL